jgi:hypothetical protein
MTRLRFRVFLVLAVLEIASLGVLLINLATRHDPTIARVIGPVHGRSTSPSRSLLCCRRECDGRPGFSALCRSSAGSWRRSVHAIPRKPREKRGVRVRLE